MAGIRVWVNWWIFVITPIGLMWGFLGGSMVAFSEDLSGFILGIVVIATTAIFVRIGLQYFLVISDIGLRQWGMKLGWTQITEFKVDEWPDGLFSQYVVIAGTGEGDVELSATIGYFKCRAEKQRTKLEAEWRRRIEV